MKHFGEFHRWRSRGSLLLSWVLAVGTILFTAPLTAKAEEIIWPELELTVGAPTTDSVDVSAIYYPGTFLFTFDVGGFYYYSVVGEGCSSLTLIDFVEGDVDGNTFSATIAGLEPNTEYAVRAWVDDEGETETEAQCFTTANTASSDPTVTTTDPAANITQTGAAVSGTVDYDNAEAVTERGIVYATVADPDIESGTKAVASAGGTGSFDVDLSGLTPNTQYYARAYAVIDGELLFYGDTISFTTLQAPPTVTTSDAVANITQTGATVSGTVDYDGEEIIAERGIVYATAPDPAIGSGTKAAASAGGTGSFDVHLSGLTPNTQYYARAYATIDNETWFYGAAIPFTTQQQPAPQTGNPPVQPTSRNVTVIISDPAQGGKEVKEPITKGIGEHLNLSGTLLDADGAPLPVSELTIDADGQFTLPDIPAGEYKMKLYVTAPTGEKLAGQMAKLVVDNNGNVTFEAELIDPYGTVTDTITGEPVAGAKLTLHWSDTELNKSKGRNAGDLVILPILPDFPPNQNDDPQFSDASGQYGWMVFPDGDYYILGEKEGYEPFDSRLDPRDEQQGEDSYIRDGNIHVGVSIVKYDFQMKPRVVESGVHLPYMRGYPDGTFKPERGMSRAEVAAVLSRIFPITGETSEPEPFADVNPSHWAATEIAAAAGQRWMTGYAAGDFKPEHMITRAEFAQVLMNVMKWSPVTESSFTDVSGHWAETAIATGAEMGLLAADHNGEFYPDRLITRTEAVIIFNQLLGRHPLEINTEARWSDVPDTDKHYADIMEASIEHEYEKYESGLENWIN